MKNNLFAGQKSTMLKKSILQKILALVARATIRRYQPKIIGITGSVGKTSTRHAVYAALKKRYRVRNAEKNYNNEIGMPLVILGLPHYGRNVRRWLFGLAGAVLRVVFREEIYPEILILEYGIDRPGDMDYLLSIASPDIAVATAIGDIPVHVEFFADPEELIREKAKMVSALPKTGHAILNHDDYAVVAMKSVTNASVTTFGVEAHASVRMTNYKFQTIENQDVGETPDGITFKIEYKGSVVPVRLHGAFGEPHAYAATAAAAVGLATGMNLVEIAEALRDYTPPPGRLRLIKGIKHSLIIDDTYNAAPESMRAALETVAALPGKRKIAMLGDMLELGRFTEQAHRSIGDRAAEFLDILITVGPRAKFIADEALSRGAEPHARALSREQVMHFDDSVSAGRALDALLEPGDLVLIKGSQAMRMEKAVEEIMAHPERARELLVRQEEHWKRMS